MKKNIGEKVTFTVGEATDRIRVTGGITDILELGENDYGYEVTTSIGVFYLNNDFKCVD
jgi:hypothetical protein